jgi:hypothetical protein
MKLVVPAGVVIEVQRGQIADAGRAWLAGDGAKFVRPAPPLHPALALWNGGAGEAEVISWALAHSGFVAVLDDHAARRLAIKHGVPVIGSLRVIVKTKERGLIPLARPALEKLRGGGAYVSDELIDRAIALAREG